MRAHERRYYDLRAPEYDDWYAGRGRFAAVERPGWEEELDGLVAALQALPPGRLLDVGCGTGFLTRHLPGLVTGLDQSEAMLAVARGLVPEALFVRGDALALPFPDSSFDLVVTGHVYGHLRKRDRERFLLEARRVAPGLLIVDSARRPGVEPEAVQARVLNDGSRHPVYKRYFSPEQLVDELGGGEVVHAGTWFVAVAA